VAGLSQRAAAAAVTAAAATAAAVVAAATATAAAVVAAATATAAAAVAASAATAAAANAAAAAAVTAVATADASIALRHHRWSWRSAPSSSSLSVTFPIRPFPIPPCPPFLSSPCPAVCTSTSISPVPRPRCKCASLGFAADVPAHVVAGDGGVGDAIRGDPPLCPQGQGGGEGQGEQRGTFSGRFIPGGIYEAGNAWDGTAVDDTAEKIRRCVVGTAPGDGPRREAAAVLGGRDAEVNQRVARA